MVCRFHKQLPRCTKTCSWEDEASRVMAVRRLKVWGLKAREAETKAQHMGSRGCPHLTPEELRLSDADLDEMLRELGEP